MGSESPLRSAEVFDVKAKKGLAVMSEDVLETL